MRKISAKAEYACLAVLALATRRSDDPPLRIRDIAEPNNIPENYLVQILLQLKGAGLVHSTRGASGGYRLAKTADSISLGEVLTAIDGPDQPIREGDQPASRALAIVWEHVRAAERSVLNQTTIAHLASQIAPRDWVI